MTIKFKKNNIKTIKQLREEKNKELNNNKESASDIDSESDNDSISDTESDEKESKYDNDVISIFDWYFIIYYSKLSCIILYLNEQKPDSFSKYAINFLNSFNDSLIFSPSTTIRW